VQMIADGAIRDLLEAREVVRRSATPERFEPSNRDAWDDAYGRFRALADMTR
jgi:rhamnulokinase